MGATTKTRNTTETERKYDGVDDTSPDQLAGPLVGVGAIAAVAGDGVVSLTAEYYDTRDERLAAQGITLRRRTGGHDAGWHLKLPVGPDTREEIQAPLADRPPEALVALVRSRVRRAELLPLVTLRTRRDRRALSNADGTELAELVLDQVTAERGEHTARWSEVEVELAEGADPALLDAVEERLAAAGLTRSAARSKLHRALAETGARPPEAGPAAPPADDDAAGSYVLAYARRQVRALVDLDPAVRRDLPDAVHQMRVATRRLRSALRTFRPVLDRGATDPVRNELRWLAAELGLERDREVMAERLSARLAELPPRLRLGPLDQRLSADTRTRRAEIRERVLATLDGPRYLDLLDTLDGLLAAPPLRGAATSPAREVLADVVRRDRDRLRARLRTAETAPAGTERDVALHEARKAAKRARYAAEAALPVLGSSAEKKRKRFKGVQQALGEHQDSVLARAELLRLADQAQQAGEPTFSYGVLYEREAELAAAARRKLRKLRS
ncbi:CYTH and CHAD domain-containing protein [Streptomyces sp. B6B3]|uniref:CYTH and CHAD domain-containing protein n=1 Tax=Streptomyces sp. B6B3 TaxID=3153570 RepID=UPI00325F24CC